MTTNARLALGTLLKRGDGGGPEVFTTIAEVTGITGPSLTTETIDVTSHESAGGFREFIAGLKDGGEVTFEINYIPDSASHDNTAGLLKDYTDKTLRNFEIIWPDVSLTKWSFKALITSFTPEAPATGNDKLSASVTMKVSGAPTLA